MLNNELKIQPWQYQQRVGLPLNIKIGMSRNRIKSWYEHFNGAVYVSFSGGKDSTVLLHLVRSMYPKVPAVFVDAGLEYPEIKSFVGTISNVTVIRPELKYADIIEKYGYPIISKELSRKVYSYKLPQEEMSRTRKLLLTGKNEAGKYNYNRMIPQKWKFLIYAPFKISDKCCHFIKIKPIKIYEKESSRHPFLGILASESRTRRISYLQHGCNGFSMSRPVSNPLAFWTDKDIVQYLSENKLPYSKIYGNINVDYSLTGEKGTGCMFCGFGCHMEKPNKFQRMKISHPKHYEYCMETLGFRKVLEFCRLPTE